MRRSWIFPSCPMFHQHPQALIDFACVHARNQIHSSCGWRAFSLRAVISPKLVFPYLKAVSKHIFQVLPSFRQNYFLIALCIFSVPSHLCFLHSSLLFTAQLWVSSSSILRSGLFSSEAFRLAMRGKAGISFRSQNVPLRIDCLWSPLSLATCLSVNLLFRQAGHLIIGLALSTAHHPGGPFGSFRACFYPYSISDINF